MMLPFRGRSSLKGSGIPEETLNAVGIGGAVDVDHGARASPAFHAGRSKLTLRLRERCVFRCRIDEFLKAFWLYVEEATRIFSFAPLLLTGSHQAVLSTSFHREASDSR